MEHEFFPETLTRRFGAGEVIFREGDAGRHMYAVRSGSVEFRQKNAQGESVLLRLRAPAGLAKFVARKGSVCVDGVSLTVNRAEGDVFEINLIPHTLAVTTLSRLAPGAKVNLEVDLIARYVERMLST